MRYFSTVLAFLLLLSSSSYSQEMRISDFGQWTTDYNAPSGVRYGWYWNANVWINLETAEEVDAVGIRWTTDSWQTDQTSYGTLDGQKESLAFWSIDVDRVANLRDCFWCEPLSLAFEFAVFTESNGNTIWFNNDDRNFKIPLDGEYPNH
ncbi:MAG: hypothetical protein HRU19_21770 [Pseudobacteriovorax sp.]|nr:hypothetical protein [Pseudobacteriovorax sp.]